MKTPWLIAVAVLAVLIGFASAALFVTLHRPGASPFGASPEPHFRAIRYQDSGMMVIDTATGHCWQWLGNRWYDCGTPQ